MKHTPTNRKVTVVGGQNLLGSVVEVSRVGSRFELYNGIDLVAHCLIADALERWAFNNGAEKVVTLPQADWSHNQE